MTQSGMVGGGRGGAFGWGTALQTGRSRVPQPTAPPCAPYNLEVSTDNINSSILLDHQHTGLTTRCHLRLKQHFVCVHWVLDRLCLV